LHAAKYAAENIGGICVCKVTQGVMTSFVA